MSTDGGFVRIAAAARTMGLFASHWSSNRLASWNSDSSRMLRSRKRFSRPVCTGVAVRRIMCSAQAEMTFPKRCWCGCGLRIRCASSMTTISQRRMSIIQPLDHFRSASPDSIETIQEIRPNARASLHSPAPRGEFRTAIDIELFTEPTSHFGLPLRPETRRNDLQHSLEVHPSTSVRG